MFRFLIFGAIIATLVISVITTDEAECDKKCREIRNDVPDEPLPGSNKICSCTASKYRLYECGSKKVWSYTLERCVNVPPPVDTAISKGCKAECPAENNLLIAHTEPSKYCQCESGVSTVKNCESGFYFSVDARKCVASEDTGCDGEKKPHTRTGESTGCIGTCPAKNACDHTDHLPHRDCTKFCKCNWGIPVPMNCPPTLYFNPVLQVCDWPEKANCMGLKK